MQVVAYDPALSVEAAWRLPGQLIDRTLRMEVRNYLATHLILRSVVLRTAVISQELLTQSDYITLHVPYMQQTHHMLDLQVRGSLFLPETRHALSVCPHPPGHNHDNVMVLVWEDVRVRGVLRPTDHQL